MPDSGPRCPNFDTYINVGDLKKLIQRHTEKAGSSLDGPVQVRMLAEFLAFNGVLSTRHLAYAGNQIVD